MLEFREYEDKDYSSVVKLIKDSFDHDVTKIEDDPRVAICKLTTNHRGWLSTFCDDVEF